MEMKKAFKNISEEEIEIIRKTNRQHCKALGEKQKEVYAFDNIVRVKRNPAERCWNVHFANGEWYHYGRGVWY